MPTKTIAIALHKGGVGKTVTAMAVAAGLARAGKRTLLVDLDPQGHCSLGLGVDVGPEDPTLRDFFAADPPRPLREILRPTHLPTLFVAPSNIRLARVAQALYARTRREEILRRGLEPLKDDFDYVVLDCPPSLGALVETAIAAADFIVIPSLMEARAADALQDLLDLVGLIKGEGFDAWRILPTRLDNRKTATNEAVMEALEPWRAKMFHTRIPQSEALNQAQMARTDIFTFDPKSKGALAYEELVREILDL
jgi:chromosome partitioning protein